MNLTIVHSKNKQLNHCLPTVASNKICNSAYTYIYRDKNCLPAPPNRGIPAEDPASAKIPSLPGIVLFHPISTISGDLP